MIADSCEAAIRSLDKKTENGIKTRVQEIMAGKIKENQFVHCNLTTKDLQTIEDSLVNTFSGIYHGRVKYPQDKAKDQPAAADQKEQKEPKDQPAATEQNAQPVAADQKEQETK